MGNKKIEVDILIIGGGLSGLTATWQLSSAGINASVMEARTRLGGRILTVEGNAGAECDLGPSWFWPGQPLIANVLNHFKISSYEQFVDGEVLFQQPGGHTEKINAASPMTGARRIQGGMGQLTDVIANEIEATSRYVAHKVTGLSINDSIITVDVVGPTGKMQVQANQVALAIPPRLAAELKFTPELPATTIQTLRETPTWMAGHAKFFAVYDKPFWREKGLCGTVISQHGPLSEIHDASPNSENSFSLFGFSGLSAQNRASVGDAAFIKQAIAQLVTLFGDEASQPKNIHFQDWSTETFTADIADRKSPAHHPQYGLNPPLGSAWDGRLEFISTETSTSSGGLMEGALEAGLRYSQRIIEMKTPSADDTLTPLTTNMS